MQRCFAMLAKRVCDEQAGLVDDYLTTAVVMVDTPHGRAPPLVTGTFGGADFLHSLMGEATEYGHILIFFISHSDRDVAS